MADTSRFSLTWVCLLNKDLHEKNYICTGDAGSNNLVDRKHSSGAER